MFSVSEFCLMIIAMCMIYITGLFRALSKIIGNPIVYVNKDKEKNNLDVYGRNDRKE